MRRLYFIAAISLLMACAGSKKVSSSFSHESLVTDGKLWSSLYQQKAAEYKALCIQAYNIARLRLDEALEQPSAKPKAIITDIDEAQFASERNLLGNVLRDSRKSCRRLLRYF